MGGPRIGACSWSLRPRDPADLAARLRRVGLDAVQLALVPVMEEAATWGGAFEALRRDGVSVLSGMLAMAGEDYASLESIRRTGGVRPDSTWPVNLARAEAAAQAAAQAGVGLVTFHAGFLPHRDGPLRRTMLKRLRALADAFAARGVDVGLETGQESAATLAGVLEELDRPAVGVNFDPANMILYGTGDPVEGLRRLAGRVRQVHVKDALPPPAAGQWGREVPAGGGAVDWGAFFEVAETIEPPLAFIIEREAGDDRLGEVAAARALIERHLGTMRQR